MLPFFRRFKKFFMLRSMTARSKRYLLVERVRTMFRRDFVEGTLAVVRMNIRVES